MNIDDLRSKLLPLLLSGARRETCEELLMLGNDRDQALLRALCLTGQSLRFTLPPIPAEFSVERWPRDERQIVPSRLRRPILRLLDRSTEDTTRAIALALEKQKLRPHPFDLPALDGFVRRYAALLGVTAQFWVQRETPAQRLRSYFDADEISSENWTEAPLRARVRCLRELRKQDAGAARKLLEQSWSGENPDARVQLLSILHSELSQEDRQFLESIQKDRAPRARAIVHRMLATLSGTGVDNPALAACMERIQRSKAGLLKKRNALKLELPANVKENEINRWIQDQFADIPLAQFANACEMTDRELVQAAENDSNLLFALALMASREKRVDLLDAITDEIPDAWGRMSELGSEDDSTRNRDDTVVWATALVKPEKWLPQIPFPAWSWLHRQIEGSLPSPIMQQVLKSETWKDQLDPEKKGGSELVQVMCALCPPDLRGMLRAQLEPLEADRKDKGWMLLDILDALERVQ